MENIACFSNTVAGCIAGLIVFLVFNYFRGNLTSPLVKDTKNIEPVDTENKTLGEILENPEIKEPDQHEKNDGTLEEDLADFFNKNT
tara:strand:+ start:125 stop:385 length:261 start_codon:yes stop_codon:yes gene_type:complete